MPEDLEEKKAILIYPTWLEGTDHMKQADRREFLEAIVNYQRSHQEPAKLSNAGQILWPTVKKQIDSNNQRRTNGRKGGRPKTKPKVSNKEE